MTELSDPFAHPATNNYQRLVPYLTTLKAAMDELKGGISGDGKHVSAEMVFAARDAVAAIDILHTHFALVNRLTVEERASEELDKARVARDVVQRRLLSLKEEVSEK